MDTTRVYKYIFPCCWLLEAGSVTESGPHSLERFMDLVNAQGFPALRLGCGTMAAVVKQAGKSCRIILKWPVGALYCSIR